MKKRLFLVCWLFLCVFLSACEHSNHPYQHTTIVKNPIIPGFNPDPSIVRVGGTYYLATSTFEYFPGVPIYSSRNLANWELIGHALHRPSQLDLQDVQASEGIHAPTLRYHNGLFYMITTQIAAHRQGKPKGNFYVTASNPAGPWSEPNWIDDAPGIDPSLFFDDDGKVYYTGNSKLSSYYINDPDLASGALHPKHRLIWTQELNLSTGQLMGRRSELDPKPYFESGRLGSVTSMEGPHLYKKDGQYYLLASHGGTGENHAVSVWKGPSVHGPWELSPNSPIVTHRDYSQSGIAATGHADLVQANDGQWWAVMLAVRANQQVISAMGRETFLAPVDWSGEWPIVNKERNEGRVDFTVSIPTQNAAQIQAIDHGFFDDFNQASLKPQWLFVRNPLSQWWDLRSEKGTLRLTPQAQGIAQYSHPGYMGVRVTDASATVSTRMNFNPNEKEQAGLSIQRSHEAYWTLVKEIKEDNSVVSIYEHGKRIVSSEGIPKGPVELKIVLNDLTLQFAYRFADDQSWKVLASRDASALGYSHAGRYTGTSAGPFVFSNGEPSNNTASFNWYKMTPEPQNFTICKDGDCNSSENIE